MLHVTSISPSSSLNSLDLDCHVAREAFRVENIKHAQKKKVPEFVRYSKTNLQTHALSKMQFWSKSLRGRLELVLSHWLCSRHLLSKHGYHCCSHMI
jgi:hypothetical protein